MKSPTENLKLRGNDPTGHGYYGAKRGTRKHKGLDVVALPKEKIYSPITGFFKRIGQVYSHTKKYNLIEIVNDVYSIKLMYVEPYDFKANEFIADHLPTVSTNSIFILDSTCFSLIRLSVSVISFTAGQSHIEPL